MAAGVEPMQQKDAHVLLLKALSMFENENVKIELTGHSLGGSLAQIESARTGIPATTFNAFGTGKILQSQGFSRSQIYKLNIKNYGNPMDPIFNSNSIYQPGRTFITNTILDINKIYPFTNTFGKADMIYHELEKMGDLNKAVEVTPFVKKMNSNNVYHGYVYKIDKIYQDVDNLNIKQNNKNIQNIQSNYTPSDVQLQAIKSLYNMNSIANFHSKEVYNYGLNNSNNVQTDDFKRAVVPTSPKVQANYTNIPQIDFDKIFPKTVMPTPMPTVTVPPVDITSPTPINNNYTVNNNQSNYALANTALQLLKTIWQNRRKNDLSDSTNFTIGENRIFTREDVGQMSQEEFDKNEKAIMAQLKDMNGLPTN